MESSARHRRDSGAVRMARLRARRRAALVKVEDQHAAQALGVKLGDWVRPDPHHPSDYSYTTTGCGHCRPEHTYAARVRKVAHRETDVLSLSNLALAAVRHLDARTRAATVPPPPAAKPSRRPAHRRT